ncbi:hypothetical protein [Paraburkholderia terricola]|uniref:Quinol monooxygenase YgiN n=1 Tax=Paraburkholderia terricola TaxID=169427 RepID=A0ABU1M037_9BURK|nr:hypothetical protein [Paraburkholderia terricola]MDR6412373.1 hypothetical protein [Paraburkholderia terricola]MDR6481177.1 hypothetical protein [Paraburkholderia terricola]
MSIVATVKVRASSGQPFDLPGDERLATVARELSRSGFRVLNSGWFDVTFMAEEQHLQKFFHILIPSNAPFSSPVSPDNWELARLVESLDIPSHSSSYA